MAGVSINNDILVCPRCGGDNLHHEGIEVFSRPREDGAVTGLIVRRDATAGPVDPTRNPSSRRHGLIIHFSCETCGLGERVACELEIAQHKGNTFLFWNTKC